MLRVFFRTQARGHAWKAGLCGALALLSGCRKQAPPAPPEPPASASASADTRPRRRPPAGAFRCEELRPAPATEASPVAETIELGPPSTGKLLVMSKMAAVVTFDREDFLKAARCLELPQAVDYLERETGHAPESPIMDAFALSYVAAAMLDAGRASVRLQTETTPRTSILRDGWAADGCGGRCRSFGRLYRLSEDDPSFFLRVTDRRIDRD